MTKVVAILFRDEPCNSRVGRISVDDTGTYHAFIRSSRLAKTRKDITESEKDVADALGAPIYSVRYL